MAKLSTQQQIFTGHVARLIIYAHTLGIELTFGEAYRTEYQQKEYLRTGKSKTMNSNHLRRLAVDFNFFIKGQLVWDHKLITELGEFWEALDTKNRWGGNFNNFKDTPHFERNI
jgi:hypothetical protein